MNDTNLARRRFFQLISAAAATVLASAAEAAKPALPQIDRTRVKQRKPYVAIQVGVVSFVDEGTDKVLDIFQEKAHINTLWLNTFTYERGTGGRQIPGHPLPDHGVQAYDTDYHGGAFYDYDPRFFRHTVLDDFRAPDYNRLNILKEVLPKAKTRGIDVVAWDYNNVDRSMPAKMRNYELVVEVDVYGRRTNTACFNNENYRNFLFGKIKDLLKTYPDLSGIAWGCERQGPLMNMIGGSWTTPFITCFCSDCLRKGRQRGISTERARTGYIELGKLFDAGRKGQRPTDGYF